MMLTRSRARRLRFSINVLPLDVFTMIIDELDPSPSERALLARVCKRWQAPFSVPLYRDVSITNGFVAPLLVNGGGLNRWNVERLSIGDGKLKEMGLNIETILDHCPHLAELHVARNFEWINTSLLGHPSLKELKSLSLLWGVRPLSTETRGQLRSTSGLQSLTSLELSDHYLDTIPNLLHVAVGLERLVLPRYSPKGGIDDSTRLKPLLQFLKKCSSLLHYSTAVSTSSDPRPSYTALSLQLNSIPTGLKTLTLTFSPYSISKEFLDVIEEAMTSERCLCSLGTLRFTKVSLWKLKTLKGWDKLEEKLGDRRVKLFTKDKPF